MAPPTVALEKLQDEDVETKIASWPTEKGWIGDILYQYQGFWFERPFLDGVIHAQETFKPRPNDVVLATFPKAGTTWFAALLFSTMNRARFDFPDHPLLRISPQDVLRWIEFPDRDSGLSSEVSISPLVKTHIPYSLLPDSIKYGFSDVCPVIYVCRSPLDVFVSLWNFANEVRCDELLPLRLDEMFDLFCRGRAHYGCYWDHVLEYWKASLERPDQVLFVRYEDMKSEPITLMKKMASFVGCPFSIEEEQDGVIDKIVEFCSFDSLASFQVNQDVTKRGRLVGLKSTNKAFFRKGKVGDHKNFLSDEMIQKLKEVTCTKFKDTGLDVFT